MCVCVCVCVCVYVRARVNVNDIKLIKLRDKRVPGFQSREQLQPIRTSQIIFFAKCPKSGRHVGPTSQSLATAPDQKTGGFRTKGAMLLVHR